MYVLVYYYFINVSVYIFDIVGVLFLFRLYTVHIMNVIIIVMVTKKKTRNDFNLKMKSLKIGREQYLLLNKTMGNTSA